MATLSTISEKLQIARAYYLELLNADVAALTSGKKEKNRERLNELGRLIRALEWDVADEVNDDDTTVLYTILLNIISNYNGDTLSVDPEVVIPDITIIVEVSGITAEEAQELIDQALEDYTPLPDRKLTGLEYSYDMPSTTATISAGAYKIGEVTYSASETDFLIEACPADLLKKVRFYATTDGTIEKVESTPASAVETPEIPDGTLGLYEILVNDAGVDGDVVVDLSGYALKSELTFYLPLTGGSLSGTLNSNTNKVLGAVATTDFLYSDFTNTGGQTRYGTENSAGNGLFVGSLPYSTVFGSYKSTPLHLGTNGVVHYTLDEEGNSVWTGLSATFSGKIDVNGTGVANGITINATGTNGVANLRLAGGETGGGLGSVVDISAVSLGTNVSNLTISTRNGSTVDEAVRIKENGNVLIGTTIENGSKLQVNGTASVATPTADAHAVNKGYADATYAPIGSMQGGGNSLPLTGIDYSGKTITFFGDSITVGTGASIPANRWTTLLSNYLGATEDNRGVLGTLLQKGTPLNPTGVSPNMVDNMTSIPTKTSINNLLVISYGINDVGYNAGNYTPENYQTDYNTIIDYAINTKGWNPESILINAPSYANSTGYAAYTFYGVTTPATSVRHLEYIEAARQVSIAYGTLYVDMYTPMANNGASDFLDADGLHPNDSGYMFIANLLAQYLSGTQLKGGSRQFNNIATSSTGAVVNSVASTTTTTGTAALSAEVSTSKITTTSYGSAPALTSALGIATANASTISKQGGKLSIGTSDANTVSFATNNLERLRIAADGAEVRVDANALNIYKNHNAGTSFGVSNGTSGSAAQAQFAATCSSGSLVFGKFSPTTSTLQNIIGSDAYVYTNTGNIAFANGNVNGNINFAAGNSSTPQLAIYNTGSRIRIGGTTSVPSASVVITSTTQGFLMPRMTTSERDGISSPAEGLQIYNLTTHKINFWNGTAWRAITDEAA